MRHFLAVLSLGLALAGAYSALAQPAPPPHERATITVQGDGKSETRPDYVAISADVATSESRLNAAQKAHGERPSKARRSVSTGSRLPRPPERNRRRNSARSRPIS